MTVNWSKSNRSWRDRDRQQRLQLKSGGIIIDFNDARIAWVGLLTLASLFLYVVQQFQRYAPEPYMVRALPDPPRLAADALLRCWKPFPREAGLGRAPRPPRAAGLQLHVVVPRRCSVNARTLTPTRTRTQDEIFHERQTRAYCNGQWGACVLACVGVLACMPARPVSGCTGRTPRACDRRQ